MGTMRERPVDAGARPYEMEACFLSRLLSVPLLYTYAILSDPIDGTTEDGPLGGSPKADTTVSQAASIFGGWTALAPLQRSHQRSDPPSPDGEDDSGF